MLTKEIHLFKNSLFLICVNRSLIRGYTFSYLCRSVFKSV